MNRYAISLAFAAAMLAIASADAAETRVSAGIDYSTGDYGETQDTDIVYIPVTGEYQTDGWIAELTIPYIRITGPGTVLPDVGRVGTGPARRRTTEGGLGDIVFSLTREMYASREYLIDLTGKVKLGTADESRGLGTGENDYSLQVDGYTPIDRATAFGNLGYRVMGDAPGVELDNVLFGSLGFSYPVSGRVSSGAILDLRERTSPSGDPRRELTAFATNKLDRDWDLQGYVVRGFSDGSPDWALGLVLVYKGKIFPSKVRPGQ